MNIDAQTNHHGVRLLVVKSKRLFITRPQGINVRENRRDNQEWRIHAKTQATLDTIQRMKTSKQKTQHRKLKI